MPTCVTGLLRIRGEKDEVAALQAAGGFAEIRLVDSAPRQVDAVARIDVLRQAGTVERSGPLGAPFVGSADQARRQIDDIACRGRVGGDEGSRHQQRTRSPGNHGLPYFFVAAGVTALIGAVSLRKCHTNRATVFFRARTRRCRVKMTATTNV